MFRRFADAQPKHHKDAVASLGPALLEDEAVSDFAISPSRD
ncbi:MAG: hypothetical protein ABI541_05110 [Betaproteobacteria bacterium]